MGGACGWNCLARLWCVFVTLGAVFLAPQSWAQGERPPHERFTSFGVSVTSSTQELPVSALEVKITASSGVWTSVTHEDGYALFPDFSVTDTLQASSLPGIAGLPAQEEVLIEIEHPDYVPVSVTRVVSESMGAIHISVMPRTAGTSTELIDPTVSSRHLVPHVGFVVVPAGAATIPITLHVVPLGPLARSDNPTPASELIDQFWIGTQNAAGQWVEAIPSITSGVLLLRTIPDYQAPEMPFLNEGLKNTVTGSTGSVATLPVQDGTLRRRRYYQVMMPIGPGVNSITREVDFGILNEGYSYDYESKSMMDPSGLPVAAKGEALSPSNEKVVDEIKVNHVSDRMDVAVLIQMVCGQYVAGASTSVTTGETRTVTHSLESSLIAEIDSEIESVLSKVGSKVGSKLTVGETAGTLTSTASKSEATVPGGVHVPVAMCWRANVTLGVVISTWKVTNCRTKYRRDGPNSPWEVVPPTPTFPQNPTVSCLGNLESAGVVEVWFKDTGYYANCPGCEGVSPGEFPLSRR